MTSSSYKRVVRSAIQNTYATIAITAAKVVTTIPATPTPAAAPVLLALSKQFCLVRRDQSSSTQASASSSLHSHLRCMRGRRTSACALTGA